MKDNYIASLILKIQRQRTELERLNIVITNFYHNPRPEKFFEKKLIKAQHKNRFYEDEIQYITEENQKLRKQIVELTWQPEDELTG